MSELRRLKCGEEKPSCERCVKSGWPCDGYGHLIEPSPKLPRGSSPKPALAPLRSKSRHSRSPTPSRTPSCSPSCGAPLDEREQQYFQTFVDLRSTNIIDRDAFVWRDVALKESRTSSCVRHALAAIGALAMSTQTTPSGIHFMDLPQSDHREFALHQYEKAIQSLRSSIGELETPESCRQTLVSCLVLAFFDNFIGNGGFAVQHMRFARNILLNSVPFRMPPPSPDPHDPEELLWYMFLQLEQQDMASMGIGDNRLYVPLEPVPAKSIMPDHFPNLQEALTYMHALLWEGYHFQYCNAYCNSVPRDTISLDVQEDRICLTEQIHRFHAAVEPLMVAEPPDSTSHPLLRASSLKYPTIVLLIRLTLTLNTPEIEVDSLLPYFEYIFSTARDVLEYEAEIDSTSSLSPPLFRRNINSKTIQITKPTLSKSAPSAPSLSSPPNAASLLFVAKLSISYYHPIEGNGCTTRWSRAK